MPRVRLAPRAVESDGDDACFLSGRYGLTPLPWQEDVLGDWLGRRRDGRWAAATCGLAVSRQNGKNAVIEVRELYGMAVLGEKFLHTAHEVKTARKAFLRIASFFENPRQFPEMSALVRDIRKTNGQEAIFLLNGGSIEFIARSRGSGRGFTVDVLVCDESQELTDEELAALLPTISASPSRNPQVIITGTPPDPDRPIQGEVFRRIRNDGQLGRDARLAWTDFGVVDGPIPDVADRALWLSTNPSAPDLLAISEIEREYALMSPERFATERLGWWGDPNAAASKVFPGGTWLACLDPSSQMETDPVFALDVSPSRTNASIATAGQVPGAWHVEVTQRHGVVDARPDLGWVVPRIAELSQAFPKMRLVVASGSAAESLLPSIQAMGVQTVVATDVPAACGFFYDRVVTRELRHLGQPQLDGAVANATRREIGDNAFVWWRRKSTGDITPLYAATLALWQAEQDRNDGTAVINNVW